MYKIIIGIAIAFVVAPIGANADVLFSEIAWMGTTEDANSEWIEIYNFSSEMTDLTGWTLSDDNSLNIELSGMMPPHGVFLLERTDDTTVPDIPASIIYTGALVNTGATLTIRDADGQVVGSPLVGGEDWVNIGGNNEFKYTAQSTRTGEWVTGPPTPGLPNIEENAELPESIDNTVNTSGGGGGGPARMVKSSDAEPLVLPGVTLELSLEAPDVAYVHQPIHLSVEPSGVGSTILASLQYSWNLGDLTTQEGNTASHFYKYPGTYVVVASAEYKRQHAQVRHEITVLPVTFSITKNTDGDIQVNNDSPYEVDLSGYSVRGDKTIVLPSNTILLPRATLTIPKNKIGGTDYAWLFDQEQMIVASTLPTQQLAARNETREVATAQSAPLIVPQAVIQHTPTIENQNNNFSFEKIIVDDIEKIEEIVEIDEEEESVKNIATVNEAKLPISNDKLPFLGIIGVLSLGILALYASKVPK